MTNATIYLGDTVTLSVPLATSDGTAFTPGTAYNLIFTAKYSADDADSDAVIQKLTGAGLTVTTSTAAVEIVPADTVNLSPGPLVCDIQAQHLTTGAVLTAAKISLLMVRDVTRETTTSIQVYTTNPPAPGGGTGGGVTWDVTAPTSPTEGQGWGDSETGILALWDGTVWVSTTSPDADTTILPAHPKTITLLSALHYYGAAPAAAFAERLESAFQLLDSEGLLDDLVSGAYYGTDGNVATGAPLDLNGVAAAAFPGSFTRNENGLVFNGSDTQVVSHVIADTQVGTLCLDYRYDGSSIAFGQAFSLCPAGGVGTALALSVTSPSADVVRFYQKNGGAIVTSSPFAETTAIDRLWSSYSKNRMRLITTYGDATSTQMMNGVVCHISPSADLTYSHGTEIVRAVVGGTNGTTGTDYANVFKGEFYSWLLFSRELTVDEQRVADRVLQLLDGRPVLWVAEGDSTVQDLSTSSTRANDNWPYLLEQTSGWDSVRFVNLAKAGDSLATVIAYWAQQEPWNLPTHFAARAYFSISGDINGIAGGKTAAQSYADLQFSLRMARLMGFTTVALTMAVPAWTGGDVGFITIANAYNALVRAGHAAGDFDYLIDAALLVPSHDAPYDVMWEDASHLNEIGNALIAAEIASQITI